MKPSSKVRLFSIFWLTALTASYCTAQEPEAFYVTPSIKGQLIDSQTDQPLSNITVYLTVDIQGISDNTGRFELHSMQKIDSDNMGKGYFKALAEEASIMIDTQGYQRRLFAIDGMAKSEDDNLKSPMIIDMGNIYLKPLPDGLHRYGIIFEYIETMPYCQPSQSQKEVECIPVPKALTHTQVSSIQTSK